TALTEPRHHLVQDLGTVLENPELSYVAPSTTLRYRNTYRRLVHVQSDKNDIVHQARPPCMRLCAGHPAQPSTVCMPRTGRRSLSGHRVYAAASILTMTALSRQRRGRNSARLAFPSLK